MVSTEVVCGVVLVEGVDDVVSADGVVGGGGGGGLRAVEERKGANCFICHINLMSISLNSFKSVQQKNCQKVST